MNNNSILPNHTKGNGYPLWIALLSILSITVLLIIFFIAGIIGAGELVLDEIQTGNGCPKIWVIPACVIILVCFLVPFVAHLKNKWNKLYFLFTGLAFVIAIIASVMQFSGNGECPKTDGGIPMCYLSLLVFSLLIGLKIISNQLSLKASSDSKNSIF